MKGVGLAVAGDFGHVVGHGRLVFELVPVEAEQAALAVAAAPQQDGDVDPGLRVRGGVGKGCSVLLRLASEAIDSVWPDGALAACVVAAVGAAVG